MTKSHTKQSICNGLIKFDSLKRNPQFKLPRVTATGQIQNTHSQDRLY